MGKVMTDFADVTQAGVKVKGFVEEEEEIDEENGTVIGEIIPYFYSDTKLELQSVVQFKNEEWTISSRTSQNDLYKHKIVKQNNV